MNAQLLLENYRTWLATTLTNDAKSVIDILNKNGFPTSYSVGNDKLIEQSLKGLQVSKTFGDDLNQLILKNNSSSIQNFVGSSKKSNFAAQPEVMTILNDKNMEIIPNNGQNPFSQGPMLNYPLTATQIFEADPLFTKNC
jgi:hypothetical protein